MLLIAETTNTFAVIALIKVKFSLRTLLIAFAVMTIFFAWRYSQRSNCQTAARKVSELGSEVFYGWQSPRLVNVLAAVPNAYFQIEVPYTEMLPSGVVVTKTRVELSGRNPGYTVETHEFRIGSGSDPGFHVGSFLLGSHSDVAVTAISIPAKAVDEKLVEWLSKMQGLQHVILCVEPRVFSVEASTRSTAEVRNEDLRQLTEDRNRAVKLLEDELPNIAIHRRGLLVADRADQ